MGLLYKVKTQESVQPYSPNLFIRAGLFALTCIIVLGTYLLLLVMGGVSAEGYMRITFVVWGLLMWMGMIYFIRGKHHRHSGVDDGLNWMGIAFMGLGLTGWFQALPNDGSALIWMVLCGIGTLLTSDRFLALATFTFALMTIYFASQPVHEIGLICMGVFSLIVYWLAVRGLSLGQPDQYQDCLEILTYVALAALYTSLNYYFADTTGYRPFRFGWGFVATTALIPITYLMYGMVEKDRALLDIGVLALAASVLTFRYYHPLLPVEAALTLAGTALILISWGLIRYLRTPRHGFTSAKDPASDGRALQALKVAQTLVVNQAFGPAPAPGNSSATESGGGSFGGGGAGDSW
jgi:hypothetical protein